MTRRWHSRPAAAATAILLAVGVLLAGCTSERTGQPAPAVSSGEVVPMPHLRQAGPDGDGKQVTLRLGDWLQVTPTGRPAGWVVAQYTSDILRLRGSNGAAARHTFLAIGVGDGRLSLAPADQRTRPIGVFTLRVRVLRDMIQPPQP